MNKPVNQDELTAAQKDAVERQQIRLDEQTRRENSLKNTVKAMGFGPRHLMRIASLMYADSNDTEMADITDALWVIEQESQMTAYAHDIEVQFQDLISELTALCQRRVQDCVDAHPRENSDYLDE